MRMIECRWFGERGAVGAALLGVTTYGSFLASVVGRLYRIVGILGAFSRHSHEQIRIVVKTNINDPIPKKWSNGQ